MRQAMAALGSQKRHQRINPTDPEDRLKKGRQGIVAGYNAQAMGCPVVDNPLTALGSIRSGVGY